MHTLTTPHGFAQASSSASLTSSAALGSSRASVASGAPVGEGFEEGLEEEGAEESDGFASRVASSRTDSEWDAVSAASPTRRMSNQAIA